MHGDRKVYSVSAFNRGVAGLARAAAELVGRGRGDRAAPARALGAASSSRSRTRTTAACLPASIARRHASTRSTSALADGERVHVFGRPELFEARASCRLRALSIERFGEGAHLAALERLKRTLAAEGLFAAERKRPLPRFPRAIGLVTGSDAAARGDLVTTISTALPAGAHRSSPRRSSRARAPPPAIVAALRELCRAAGRRRRRARARRRQLRGSAAVQRRAPSSARSRPARCRSSPRSVTSRTRRSATSPPTRAPRRRRPPHGWSSRTSASCTAARRARSGARAGRPRAGRARRRSASARAHERLRRGARAARSSGAAPALDRAGGRLRALSPRATLERGYAIVRAGDALVTRGERARAGRARRRRARRRRASAPASRRCARERRADVRGAAERARAHRRAARARPDARLDEALQLWERGEELHRALPQPGSTPPQGRVEELAEPRGCPQQ